MACNIFNMLPSVIINYYHATLHDTMDTKWCLFYYMYETQMLMHFVQLVKVKQNPKHSPPVM